MYWIYATILFWLMCVFDLKHQLWLFMVQAFFPNLCKMEVQLPVSWTVYFGWLLRKRDAQLKSIAQEEELQRSALKWRYYTSKITASLHSCFLDKLNCFLISYFCHRYCISPLQTNIEPCPECGNLKQKHTLCGYCYAKVRRETGEIRKQIFAIEGKPLNTPAVETVVLYADETPEETDKGKRIVERPRKRPSWFTLS